MRQDETERRRRFDALFAAYTSDLVAYCGWRAGSALRCARCRGGGVPGGVAPPGPKLHSAVRSDERALARLLRV